jgi:3-deoxy-manno-octulosonate cytidylyltransferase (CMP-KDO synthetase)
MSRSVIVIPARYASTRLPAKPLLHETGKFLIQHVVEQANLATDFDSVIVATDDPRIQSAVQSFGGKVVMTRDDHPSGTDRIAEVAMGLDPSIELVINLQGDEPEIDPASLEKVRNLLIADRHASVATLATPIRDSHILNNPNCVKVVCNQKGRALYFSRSPIPFSRDAEPDLDANPPKYLLHLGLYAYRRNELLRLAKLSPDPIEMTEKLEQLRFLRDGVSIAVGIVETRGEGIDTPEDYERFVARFRRTQVPN